MNELEIVLFLDVDGVLNTWSRTTRDDGSHIGLERDFVRRLRQIVEKYSLKIVFCSTHSWHLEWQKAFIKLLQAEGVEWDNIPIVDRIPRSYIFGNQLSKTHEIDFWNKHFQPKHFVVLEDTLCGMPEMEPYWIKCDHDHGFTQERAKALVAVLDSFNK